jgi:chemotaxis protein MotB
LLSQLDAKGKALAIEQERLNKSAQRLQELESLIRQRSNNEKLKETLSNALNSFEGKGLTVEQKKRKVYPWKTNYCLIPVVGP